VDVPAQRVAAEALRPRRAPRPVWWIELVFLGGCYWLYSVVRNVAPSHTTSATRRAVDLLNFEHTLHIDAEKSLNSFVAHTHWLAYGANYYYATMHFIVTLGVLVWLYLRRPVDYRRLRTAWLATNVTALLGFYLFALAPPRMLPGFVDTVVHFHTWGSWGSTDVNDLSNQYAAMPSLHIAWALWCAVAVVTLSRRTWLRVVAALYPVATLFVVLGTANHFALDAVGGAVVLAAGFGVDTLIRITRARLISRKEDFVVDEPSAASRSSVVLD
jgi:hypothetical protein